MGPEPPAGAPADGEAVRLVRASATFTIRDEATDTDPEVQGGEPEVEGDEPRAREEW